ncbi:cytochrome c peroxidase [Cyclobacterium sediminis]
MPAFEEVEKSAPEYYVPVYSSSLQQDDFPQPERNYLSKEGMELGKTLFFDPELSANGKVSCAGCHLPEKAFSDGLALTNIGVSGSSLHRNSPALFNLAWHDGLFWEGGANDLESMVFGPLTHPDEMAADLNEVLEYINTHEAYPLLFQEAFSSDSITSSTIARSLAQFMRTLISDDSKYDQWKRGEAGLSSEELKGYEVYKEHCSSCHKEGLFTDLSYHNNGLDSSYPDPPELEGLYQGRYRITYKDEDKGAYKTASLRNLSFTAPYMHDGRFANLEQVLDHYETGIKTNETLAPQLENGIVLSATERTQLLAFLNSLNDYNFITNPAYQK